MIDPRIIFGRLGNQMFQYAALYTYATDMGEDFYFQNLMWFEGREDEIRKLYSTGIPEPTDKVAIHVRRAANPINSTEPKYCENPFHFNLCATDYYERAMAMFPGEKFLIFSDDPLWCEEHFKGCEISYGTELEDLNKMASCKAHIIANSSYSWWGAWLSPLYPHNRVIAPKQFFTDGITRTKLPSHWETI